MSSVEQSRGRTADKEAVTHVFRLESPDRTQSINLALNLYNHGRLEFNEAQKAVDSNTNRFLSDGTPRPHEERLRTATDVYNVKMGRTINGWTGGIKKADGIDSLLYAARSNKDLPRK